jgi:hypothetical protein
MYLTVTFGFEGPTRQVAWGLALDQFPKHFRYGGKKWEWLTYDKDPTGKSEYALLYSELHTYDPDFYIDMEDFEEKFFGWGKSEGCTCGAVFSSSFPFDHMRYCKMWKSWDQI